MPLSKLLQDSQAPSIIEKLMLDKKLEPNEKGYILSLAILMLKNSNLEKQTKVEESYFKLAQFIITKYSIIHKDYVPLYDFAMSIGDYPIGRFILKTIDDNIPRSIQQILADISLWEFEKTAIDGRHLVQTYQQKLFTDALLKEPSRYLAYIAPTSYGKSEFIIDYLENKQTSTPYRIAYIAPTNLLIDQTASMLRKTLTDPQYKIILHYEAFDPERDASKTLLAVFTQERGIEFLLKYKESFFDYVIIDEAHELFPNNERSRLLQLFIEKNETLNPGCSVLFLSPVACDGNNFIPKDKQKAKNIFHKKISRSMKIPILYHYDSQNLSSIKYDQFLQKEYTLPHEYKDAFEYISHHASKQNLIFLTSPKMIEDFTQSFIKRFDDLASNELNNLAEMLSKKVNKEFYLVNSIKKGVIYLHGKLPDNMREYLVEKLKTIPTIKYLIGNHVVLSGLNIPVETLFVLKYPHRGGNNALTNLIGRVNRLSYILDTSNKENIKKLLCHVHFVSTKEYDGKTSLKHKMTNWDPMEMEVKDRVNNVLLKKESSKETNTYKKNEKSYKKKAILNEYRGIENPQNITESETEQLLYVCGLEDLYNTISSDLLKSMQTYIRKVQTSINDDHPADLHERVFEAIYTIFFTHDNPKPQFGAYKISRLQEPATRKFYINFLKNQKSPLVERITRLTSHWKSQEDPLIYIGEEYGEVHKENDPYSKKMKNYIDLRTKNDRQIINLAIVKIHMDDEFVGFNLQKFFKFLNLVGVLSNNDLKILKYGEMTEQHGIDLISYGLDPSIVHQLERNGQLRSVIIEDKKIIYNENYLEYYKNLDDFDQFLFRKHIPLSEGNK